MVPIGFAISTYNRLLCRHIQCHLDFLTDIGNLKICVRYRKYACAIFQKFKKYLRTSPMLHIFLDLLSVFCGEICGTSIGDRATSITNR
jgi:hypothetical protein